MANSKNSQHDYRLVLPASACWVGVALGQFHVWTGPIWVLPVTVAALLWKFRRSALPVLSGLAISFALSIGFCSGQMAARTHALDPAVIAANEVETLRLQVQVDAEPTRTHPTWGGEQIWVQARVRFAQVGGQWRSSRASVILRGPSVIEMKRGETWTVAGPLKTGFRDQPPSLGVIAVRTQTFEREPPWWDQVANHLRGSLREVLVPLPPEAATLIPALSIGDGSLIEEELRDCLKAASLIHLTVVSGAHMSMALLFLTAIMPGYRFGREVICVSFALTLVVVVGPHPSVIRAAITCLVAAWGAVVGRPSRPHAALSLVVMICVLYDPWLALSIGFALSVLATWGIIFTGSIWLEALSRRGIAGPGRGKVSGVLRRLVEVSTMTVSAQLWILPVLVTFADFVPVWGVVANVAVSPVIAPLTILSLLAAAAVGFSPDLALIFARAGTPLALWVTRVARFCAALPGARLPWPPGGGGIILAAVLVGGSVAVTIWASKRSSEREVSRGNRERYSGGD